MQSVFNCMLIAEQVFDQCRQLWFSIILRVSFLLVLLPSSRLVHKCGQFVISNFEHSVQCSHDCMYLSNSLSLAIIVYEQS